MKRTLLSALVHTLAGLAAIPRNAFAASWLGGRNAGVLPRRNAARLASKRHTGVAAIRRAAKRNRNRSRHH